MRAQRRQSKSVGGGPTERRMISSNYTSADLRLNTSANTDQLPENLKFTDNHLAVIIAYSVLFVIAAIGNLTVFITLVRGRHRMNRISLMITHLSVADLCVTFFMIPLEIGWRITTQWLAGNAACKIFLFLRAFGLYLSSNVLVCVSVDRYFAILHPLRVHNARRRGKIMLVVAWMFSFVCALPQSVVFHVSQHPNYPGFWQCVSFGFFATQASETAYNLFCVFAMYFVPLIVIIFAYTCILWKISKKSRETRADSESEVVRGRMRLRRSDMSNIERARSRTLKMTVTIVLAFIWCWTPYAVITLWYMFDRESAKKIDYRIQDALFIMAVSNSCMNPLVYGSYAMNFRRECQTCFGSLFNSHHHLHRRSTDGGGRTGDVLFVPKCVLNLVKGSGGTRSSAVAALGNLNHNHNRNQLTINRRNLRPVSAEQLMTVDRNESEEFHSDPGGANGIYLVVS